VTREGRIWFEEDREGRRPFYGWVVLLPVLYCDKVKSIAHTDTNADVEGSAVFSHTPLFAPDTQTTLPHFHSTPTHEITTPPTPTPVSYAQGVLCYMLLSGSPPFYGKTVEDVYKATSTQEPAFPDKKFRFDCAVMTYVCLVSVRID
jgi:hypothetical protein